jgi:hypothetical protein
MAEAKDIQHLLSQFVEVDHDYLQCLSMPWSIASATRL